MGCKGVEHNWETFHCFMLKNEVELKTLCYACMLERFDWYHILEMRKKSKILQFVFCYKLIWLDLERMKNSNPVALYTGQNVALKSPEMSGQSGQIHRRKACSDLSLEPQSLHQRSESPGLAEVAYTLLTFVYVQKCINKTHSLVSNRLER